MKNPLDLIASAEQHLAEAENITNEFKQLAETDLNKLAELTQKIVKARADFRNQKKAFFEFLYKIAFALKAVEFTFTTSKQKYTCYMHGYENLSFTFVRKKVEFKNHCDRSDLVNSQVCNCPDIKFLEFCEALAEHIKTTMAEYSACDQEELKGMSELVKKVTEAMLPAPAQQ